MAKKKVFRKKKQLTVPITVVAGMIPVVANSIRAYREKFHEPNKSGLTNMGIELGRILIGYDSRIGVDKWNWENMKEGSIPIALGFIAHKVGTRLGINRMLSRAGIPFLRF